LKESRGEAEKIVSLGVVRRLVELLEGLIVNVLVRREGVEYLSLRVALGASNSDSDTSKVSTCTSKYYEW